MQDAATMSEARSTIMVGCLSRSPATSTSSPIITVSIITRRNRHWNDSASNRSARRCSTITSMASLSDQSSGS